MAKTMLVKAIKVEGGYQLDADGVRNMDGVQTSRAKCYENAKLLWPKNSTWNGRKVSGGYRIDID
jgi:hypothetical protein